MVLFILLFAIAGLLMLTLVTMEVSAATLTVDDDGNAEYTKIQDAINASMDGDTVRVWDGTYFENVVVDKTVSLIGNGSEEVTIDGGGRWDVVEITADWVNISGFTISGADRNDAGIKIESDHNIISNNNCSSNTYGIYLWDSTTSTITNNTCSENNSFGIHLRFSNDCTITNNTCKDNKFYGIYLRDSGTSMITSNTCENNSRGIYFDDTNDCTITNNTCENNSLGIFLDASIRNTISDNACNNNDHGIYLQDSSNGTITNNTCENNDNGIVLAYSCNGTITNNTCSENNDDGIRLLDSSDSTIANNTCQNNDHGIGFGLSSNGTITNNTCSNNDVGISLGSFSNGTITNNTISENCVGIILYSSRDNTAHFNRIFSNTKNGIDASDNRDDYVIIATHNWWGDPSGPFHSVNNSEGKGDNVTDDVLFEPWLAYPGNQPPTAHAGNDQTSTVNEEVRFFGTGEDTDGTIVKYEWDFEDDGTFDWSSATSGETIYSYSLAGTYQSVLRVTDDDGATGTDICTITVATEEPENKIPTITITQPQEGDTVNGLVILKGTESDEDGNVTHVIVTILGTTTFHDNITINGLGTWTYEWNTGEIEDGRYWITVQCFDGFDYSVLVHLNVTVENEIDNGGGGGFIPGFEAVAVAGAVVISISTYRRKGKKEVERC